MCIKIGRRNFFFLILLERTKINLLLLLLCFIHRQCKPRTVILTITSSKIANTFLDGNQTIYSVLKVTPNLENIENLECNISNSSWQSEFWVGLQVKSQLSAYGTWAYGRSTLRGDLSKGQYSVFMQVSEKTTENSERLGRQARQGFEPGSSRLPALGHYRSTIGLTTVE